MSWQDYVDKSLIGSGFIDRAAIWDAQGAGPWAKSSGFDLSPGEVKTMAQSFQDTQSPKAVQQNGIHLAGEKYQVFKADDRSLYSRKDKTGAVIVKTKLALLIVHYPESVQPGQATKTVEDLGDYLIKAGS